MLSALVIGEPLPADTSEFRYAYVDGQIQRVTVRNDTIVYSGLGDNASATTIPAPATSARWIFTEGEGDLLSLTVELNEGRKPSTVSAEIADPFLTYANSLPLPHEDARVPVEVFRGEKVFAGFLSRVRAKGLPGRVMIEATDKAKGMRKVSRARVLTDASAAQQIADLAGEDGLEVVFLGDSLAALEQFRYAQRVQMGSNAGFLHDMLDALGATYFVRQGTLYVQEVGWYDSDAVQALTIGDSGTVARFDFDVPEITRTTTPNVYSAAGASTFEQDPTLDPETTARAVRLERTGLFFEAQDLPSFTDQTVENAARAQANAKKVFRASVALDRLDLGLDVTSGLLLRGFGGRYSGFWKVERVAHNLVPKGVTELSIYNGGGNDSGGVIGFVSDRIYFAFDSSALDAAANAVVARVAERMAQSNSRLLVTGHADETGTQEYNLALGLRRAQAVRDALVSRGVPSDRLSVDSRGEYQPAGSDYALNRRVEFRVL